MPLFQQQSSQNWCQSCFTTADTVQMRLSIGVIFTLILVWSGIFSFIFLVYRMMLVPDHRQHAVELFDMEIVSSGNDTHLFSIINGKVETPLVENTVQSDKSKKYAYVTLLHGIDDTYSYRGFLYNCFIVKKALMEQGSQADFIVLIGFTYGEDPKVEKITKDLALMQKFGIILYHLPRLDSHKEGSFLQKYVISPANTELNVSANSSNKVNARTKGSGHKKIPFLEMALLKVIPWSFTQYEKVQFFDGDVLPHKNMDCLFGLSINTFNTGNASPLNSGWYLAVPNQTDFSSLRDHAIKRLKAKKWDEKKGWGTPIPADLRFRGGKRAVTKWAFNGASLDQGLLTHYFVLHEGRVQLVDTDNAPVPVQVYHSGYQHKGSTVGEALHCCGTHATPPTEYFHHYTGRNKPWLQDLSKPKDPAQRLWAQYLDSLKLSVNSTNINKQALNSPLGYFYPNK